MNASYNTKIKFPKLETKMKEQPHEDLSSVEIHNSLFDMGPWKSPGPNGFSAGFYHKSWSMIGKTIGDYV